MRLSTELIDRKIDPRKIWVTDGWTAQKVELTKTGELSGATVGEFDPTEIAKRYVGISPNKGDVALYCLQRFGNPDQVIPDRTKYIGEWIVTTPMDGVYLTINLGGGGTFGYLLNQDVANMVSQEKYAPMEKKYKEIYEWVKKTYNVILYWPLGFYIPHANELDELFNRWGRSAVGAAWDEVDSLEALVEKVGVHFFQVETKEQALEKIQNKFFEYCRTNTEKFTKIYESQFGKIEYLDLVCDFPLYEIGWAETFLKSVIYQLRFKAPRLLKKFTIPIAMKLFSLKNYISVPRVKKLYSIPFWWGQSGLIPEINQALYRAIQDLTRPCPVRDWYVTITGHGDSIYGDFSNWQIWSENGYTLLYDYTAPRFGE